MDRMMNRVVIVDALLACLGLIMMDGQGAWGSEAPEHFYQGKTINWIVMIKPGGPMDVIIRTIAPFLSKEIGGKVRIENRKEEEGINYLYKQGTRDGLTLGSKTGDAIISNEIMKAPGVQYETDKFNFVAKVQPAIKIFQISPKLPYKTLDALRKAKSLKAAGTTTKGALAMSSAGMFEILGLDGKVITGYQGKKDLILDLARGQIDIIVTTDNSAKSDEEDGYIINLFALGNKRSNIIPNVPSLSELGMKIPKELAAVYEFISLGGIAVAMPPGVPPERLEYLRRVFQNLSNNHDLQNAIEKLTGAFSPFTSGKELQEEMAAVKRDKDLVAKLDAISKKYSAVR